MPAKAGIARAQGCGRECAKSEELRFSKMTGDEKTETGACFDSKMNQNKKQVLETMEINGFKELDSNMNR